MPSNKKSVTVSGTGNDAELDRFKDTLKTDAEHIVCVLFPAKILEINALIDSKLFDLLRLPEFDTDCGIPIPKDPIYLASGLNANGNHREDDEMTDPVPTGDLRDVITGNTTRKRTSAVLENPQSVADNPETKVFALTGGVVPANRKMVELVELVKPLVREAVEYTNKVKIWILFLIPRIEDGGNFGVSIQEETLAEVQTVEAEAASFLDQISRYYLTRGRIVAKLAKYPHVEDYRRSIVDLDQKEFWNLRLVLMELRNHYSKLHDMILKNLEKIKIPRSSNVDHLY